MARVYGDSTPFPHDIDYIHMLRDGVDCAVRLLAAQHSIRVAEDRMTASLSVAPGTPSVAGDANEGQLADALASLVAQAVGPAGRLLASPL